MEVAKSYIGFAASALHRDVAGIVVCSGNVLFLPLLTCGLVLISGTGFLAAFSQDMTEAYGFVHKHSLDEAKAIIQTKYQRALAGFGLLSFALVLRRFVLLVLFVFSMLVLGSQLHDYFVTAQVEFSSEGFLRLRQDYLMQLIGLSVLVRTMFLGTLIWALLVLLYHHWVYHFKNTA